MIVSAQYGDQAVSYVPERRYKFAIIKHGFQYRTPHTFNPDTIPMQNIPSGRVKGPKIPVESNWWHHIERINPDVRSYRYARSIGAAWINLDYDIDTPYSTAFAESLTFGGNFIAFDRETFTHVHLLSYDFRMDTNGLQENWFTHPYRYAKIGSVSDFNHGSKLGKVADGLDVYIPLIAKTDLWMNKIDLEIFPDGPDYTFYGCNVYDGFSPLLVDGVFPTRWKLETQGVLPPG